MPTLSQAVAALAPHFAGRLLLPADATYDNQRRVHNGFVDRRPGVIAVCAGTAGIVEAVALATSRGLDLSVRGGGHNVAGQATLDDGVMIDLSGMREVHVDPKTRTALVGGGATWKEFNRETQAFGLGATGGVISSTGVGGLTLGGGFGWLMPKYGMALDHLRAVTLVLADGRIVRASEQDHADLFWAVRGGGGNFGVAASFEFALHNVGPMVTGGMVAHPFPAAIPALRFYRDLTSSDITDDAFLVTALAHAPDGSGMKMVAIAGVHCGALDDGAAFLAPVKAFGPPIMDMMGPISYVDANTMLDPTFITGSRNYWKSHFLPTLSDDAIATLVDHFAQAPSPLCQIIVENFHGAATRVPVEATAYALRDRGYNVVILGQWLDAADDEAVIAWARAGYDKLKAFGGPRRYVNYLDNDDMTDRSLDAVYGPNLPRLRQVKRAYDPANVFRRNLNIPPA